MSRRTLLSRYIRSIRERRGFSVEFVSQKAGVSAVEYLKFEESPHSIPLYQVANYLSVLSVTGLEFIYFQVVAKASLFQVRLSKEEFTKPIEEPENKLQSDSNVLSLHGIHDVRKTDEDSISENEEC